MHNHTILPNSSFKQWKLTGFGHCFFATDVQFWYGQLSFITLNISELFLCTFVLNGLFKQASNSVATSAYQQNQRFIPFCMNAQKEVKYNGLDWVFTNSSACSTEHTLFIKKKMLSRYTMNLPLI